MPEIDPIDLNAAMPPSPRDPVPPGVYDVIIESSEMRTSRAGHDYIVLQLAITGGEHAGRRLWVNLHLSHPTDAARERSRALLVELARAAGVTGTLTSTEELHDRVVSVRVIHRRDPLTGEARPEVVAVRACATSPTPPAVTPPSPARPSQQQPPNPTRSAPPWRK